MPDLSVRFTVRDLLAADLPACSWAGSGVGDGLRRVEEGRGDYLAVCPPSDLPVALGGIDWTEHAGAGTLYQLHVLEPLRGIGLGALLIDAAEARVRARGLDRAELGVDARSPRPLRLYERLGYRAYAEEPGGWDEQLPDGAVRRYETTVIAMRKDL